MKEERTSCCDAIITAQDHIATHENEISELNKMKKWTWGSIVLPSLLIAITFGIGSDIRDVRASVTANREKHTAEYRDLEATMRSELKLVENNVNKALFGVTKDLGRNEASHIRISQQLSGIEKQLIEIAKWQREQK